MKKLLLFLFAGMSLHGATRSLIELTELNTRNNERLFHNGSNFVVQHDTGKTQEIPSYALNKEIRNHDINSLLSLQQHGYFDLQRSVEGNEYRLDFKPRLKAGGPKLAAFVNFVSRAVLNGVVWLFVGRTAERVATRGGNFGPTIRTTAQLAMRNIPGMVPGTTESMIVMSNMPRADQILDAAAPVASMVIASNPAATTACIEAVVNGLTAVALLLPTP